MKEKIRILLFITVLVSLLTGSAFERGGSVPLYDIDTTRSPLTGFESIDIAVKKKNADTLSSIRISRPSGPWEYLKEENILLPAGGEE